MMNKILSKLTLTSTSLTLIILTSPLNATVKPIEIEENSLFNQELLIALENNTIEGELTTESQKLDDNTYYNIHTFEGTEGETITIELNSNEFDTYLLLHDPESNRIAENDDFGDSKNSKIVITLPSTGTYQIYANSYEENVTGNYQLSWKDATENDITQAKIEVKRAEADNLISQGNQQFDTSQYQTALQSYQEALTIYEEINDRSGISYALGNLGNVSYSLGEYEKAIDYYQRSLAIDEEIGDHSGEATTLNNIGRVYNIAKNGIVRTKNNLSFPRRWESMS